MRFFRRDKDEERFITCPGCTQIVKADALECELCHTDLRELSADTQTFTAKELSRQGDRPGF